MNRNTDFLAKKIGFDPEEILRKADRFEDIAAGKEPDLKEATVIPYFDMNGPVVDKRTVDYSIHEGVKEAMQHLDEKSEVPLSMLSGWDIKTLEHVEQKLGINMDHVGELGGTARINGQDFVTVDADYKEMEALRKELWLEAGTDERLLQEQGNIGPVTGCTYSEGDRTGLYRNPVAADSRNRFSIEGFYNKLLETGADSETVSQHENGVAVDLEEDRNVGAMSTVLTQDLPLIGLIYESTGDLSVMIKENSSYSSGQDFDHFIDDFQDFMDRIVSGKPFNTEHNPDLSTDYIRSDLDVTKEHGANYRASMITDGEYLLTNIGDKSGDILHGENGIFFGQKDMPVQNHIENEKHLSAINAAEYALVVSEVIDRY